MVFNFRRMTSSLESMEAWAATSLAMTASRRSRLEAEGSTSAIEEQQVGPIVTNRGLANYTNLYLIILLYVFISLNEYLYMISWFSDSEKKEKIIKHYLHNRNALLTEMC